jgi:hypothetical protein
MARPQAADGDDLQILRVTVNIFNKQSQQPKRGGPPALGLDVEVITLHHKKKSL